MNMKAVRVFAAVFLAIAVSALVQAQRGQLAPEQWRPFGPMSEKSADATVAALRARLRNSAAVIDVDLRIVRRALIAANSEIKSMLASSDRATVVEAAREAGGRRAREFVPPLTKVAFGRDESESLAAVDALSAIGGEEARASLKGALRSPSSRVRVSAAVHLAESGDPSGRAVLLKRISGDDRMGWFLEPLSNKRVGAALINIGYGKNRSELHHLLQVAGEPLRTLFPLLARKGWASVNPEMRSLVADRKQYHGIRKWAAIALGEARDPKAVEPLITALSDPVPDVRAAAATALGQIGDLTALPALKRLSASLGSSPTHKQRQAVAAARKAIEAITRK
jgi:HEAT repeat protein